MNAKLIRNVCRIGAVAGIVGTAYFSAKNGAAICRELSYAPKDHGIKEQAKYYIRRAPKILKPLGPTLACAAGSITCMAISEKISYKQIAALTATCVYLTRNRDFLEKKVKEFVGEEKLKEIKGEFLKKNAESEQYFNFPSVEITPGGDLLCLEGYSGRWFRSSKEAVEEAQAMLQHMYEEKIYCCLNDYYALLGIAMTQFGHEFGWVNDKDWCDPELKFTNTFLEAGEWDEIGPDYREKLHEPLLVLEIDALPIENWQEV